MPTTKENQELKAKELQVEIDQEVFKSVHDALVELVPDSCSRAYRVYRFYTNYKQRLNRTRNNIRLVWLQSALDIQDEDLFRAALTSKTYLWNWADKEDPVFEPSTTRKLWECATIKASTGDLTYFNLLLEHKLPLPFVCLESNHGNSWLSMALTREIKGTDLIERILDVLATTPTTTYRDTNNQDFKQSLLPTSNEVHRELAICTSTLGRSKLPIRYCIDQLVSRWEGHLLPDLAFSCLQDLEHPQKAGVVMQKMTKLHPSNLNSSFFHSQAWQHFLGCAHTERGYKEGVKTLLEFNIEPPENIITSLREGTYYYNREEGEESSTEISDPWHVIQDLIEQLSAKGLIDLNIPDKEQTYYLLDVVDIPDRAQFLMKHGASVDKCNGLTKYLEQATVYSKDTVEFLIEHTTNFEPIKCGSGIKNIIKKTGIKSTHLISKIIAKGVNPDELTQKDIINYVVSRNAKQEVFMGMLGGVDTEENNQAIELCQEIITAIGELRTLGFPDATPTEKLSWPKCLRDFTEKKAEALEILTVPAYTGVLESELELS